MLVSPKIRIELSFTRAAAVSPFATLKLHVLIEVQNSVKYRRQQFSHKQVLLVNMQ